MREGAKVNKYIIKFAKGMWKECFILTLLSIIATLTNVILPYYNGLFVDILIYQPDINSIIDMTVLIICIGALEAFFSYIYNIVSVKMLNKIIYKAKMKLIEHIRRISILTIQKLNPTYLNQRINVDVLAVFQFFMENYITVILLVMGLIIEGYIVFGISIILGGLVVVFVPIYIIIYSILRKPLYKRNLENKEQQNIFFNKINDQFVLIKDIKVNADFELQNRKVNTYFKYYLKTILKYSKISYLFNSCDSIISLLFRSIMYIIAGYEIVQNNLTVGEFTMINMYFGMITSQVRYFFNLGKKYQDAKSSFDRIRELENIPEEKNGTNILRNINNIELKGIEFQYENCSQMMYKNFNYMFEKGKIYGIKGENGVGKSTLINIMIGIINEKVGGEIFYNCFSIDKLNIYWLRKEKIAVMSQEFNASFDETVMDIFSEINSKFQKDLLNSNTVKDLFGDEKSFGEIMQKRIKDLSGGEKQKVSFIWCLSKNADFLIFDEPTANVDWRGVEIIKKELSKWACEKIILVVSHDNELLEICNDVIKL